MSETQTPQLQPELSANPLGEFHPLVTPELALQTYESFGGDSHRAKAKEQFAGGSSYHLEMEYPLLTTASAETKKGVLLETRQKAAEAFGKASLTVSSIDYRILETDFLATSARLNEAAASGDSVAEQQAAEEYVRLTEQLYGKPDQAVVDSILFTLSNRYASDDPRIAQLWQQVHNGFTVELANDQLVSVPALDIPQTATPLPELDGYTAELLAKEWKLAFPAAVEALGLMTDIVAAEKGLDADYNPNSVHISGDRLVNLFRIAAQGVGFQHDAMPFRVESNPTSSFTSWESGRQAVVVGTARPEEQGTQKYTRKVVTHESMHGLKSSNGIKTHEPAMATGVYSRDSDGNFVDYLSYEEGFNRIGESLVTGEKTTASLEDNYMYYLMAGLVYRGFDDRQAKEMVGTLLTIERLWKNPQLDQSVVETEVSKTMAMRTERLFRSTPVTSDVLVDGHKPIYTKDLAYFKGELIATTFWNNIGAQAKEIEQAEVTRLIDSGVEPRIAERRARVMAQDVIHRVFLIQAQGKIDPSDQVQYAVAEHAFEAAA